MNGGPNIVTSTCIEGEAARRHKAARKKFILPKQNGAKTVKTAAKIIFASVFALSVAVPAFAQSSSYGYRTGADQQINRHQSAAVKRARNAFAMESKFGIQIESNSPEATGGGSLGYNQLLLQY